MLFMEHDLYTLEQLKKIHKLHKDQFQFLAVPARPKKYDKWCIGFHCPVASGNLVNSQDEQIKFNSLDLLLKYLHLNFKVAMFTVVVDV